MKDKRYGKIRIDMDIVEFIQANMSKPYIKHFLSMFFIVRAEMNYATNCLEFIAYSDHFRKIPSCESLPEYILEIRENRDIDGNITNWYVSAIEDPTMGWAEVFESPVF